MNMHEMAIAQSDLDIADGEIERHASSGIRKIKISVGEFSGVVKDALELALEVLKYDTPARDAEIEIETVAMATECADCGPAVCAVNDLNLLCPRCGKAMQVTAGRYMRVDYLDLE